MTAGKNQAQPIILKDVLIIGPFHRTPLRFEISYEFVLRRIKFCPSTQSINGFEWAVEINHGRGLPGTPLLGHRLSAAQRLRASPPRQDQNHRASGSELPEFVPNPRDKVSRAIRLSARWNART